MKASELPLAADGSMYHIHLTSSTLADKVLLVGDPGRVDMFKGIFESVDYESHNREMHAVTGMYHGVRMTALSTGMGCDNIDIVMTELDAAANMDNESSSLEVSGRQGVQEVQGVQDNTTAGTFVLNSLNSLNSLSTKSPTARSLQIVRIGTSGSLQEDIDCGSHVASEYAIGLDGLMNYYKEWDESKGRRTEESKMEEAFNSHLSPFTSHLSPLARPYCVKGSEKLLKGIASDMHHGITATAPGFYGPQGRAVRLHPSIDNLNEKLASFGVTNLEMETSAIYGFSHLMGHEALTTCLIIANRPKGTFLSDYHEPMRQLVGRVVERLAVGF